MKFRIKVDGKVVYDSQYDRAKPIETAFARIKNKDYCQCGKLVNPMCPIHS
jgi:hypothetical protein